MRSLELGAADGLGEALLGLFEVDDVPDGVEVLWEAGISVCWGRYHTGVKEGDQRGEEEEKSHLRRP